MKIIASLVLMLAVVSACDVYVIEPRYDPRNNVIGEYQVKEYSETYNDLVYYSIIISKDSYSDRMYLKNLYNTNLRIEAFLDYDKLVIPYQVVDGYELEGIGTVFSNRVSLRYSVRDTYANVHTDFCEAEAYRY